MNTSLYERVKDGFYDAYHHYSGWAYVHDYAEGRSRVIFDLNQIVLKMQDQVMLPHILTVLKLESGRWRHFCHIFFGTFIVQLRLCDNDSDAWLTKWSSVRQTLLGKATELCVSLGWTRAANWFYRAYWRGQLVN
jgi:hypothetical protein